MSQPSCLTPCLLFILFLCCPIVAAADDNPKVSSTCLQCHAGKQSGFSTAHAFAAGSCITCHAGNNRSPIEAGAHEDLIAFPGQLNNAQRACGSCHADRVASVTENLMHSGRGMVQVTRQSLDEAPDPNHSGNLQSSRTQCCRLNVTQAMRQLPSRPNQETEHRHDVMWDRGGGCLACHVSDYPEDAHPALTARVSDARCFGCHARSARISLNYTGLAEIDVSNESGRSVPVCDYRMADTLSACQPMLTIWPG